MHRSILPFQSKQLIDCSCTTTDCDDDSSVATVESGASSCGTLTARTVHFAVTDSGDVRCEIRHVDKIDRPADVWWQPDEDEEIRSNALHVLDHDPVRYCLAGIIDHFLEREWQQGSKASRNLFVQLLATPEVRGFERHISHRCRSMSTDHVKRVLEIQTKNRNQALLSMASKQTSMPFIRLALLKAQVDAL